ncbi:hypothetical protein J6590_078389 [Homalodisca vitripennis]|nr:hypothetical protein J6590_078389 [Homalodisca vitripennis]
MFQLLRSTCVSKTCRSVLETDVKRRDGRLLKVHGSIWPHLCRRTSNAFPTPSRSAANRLHSCFLHCEEKSDLEFFFGDLQGPSTEEKPVVTTMFFCSNLKDQTPKEKAATSLLPPPSIFCIRTTENSRRTI